MRCEEVLSRLWEFLDLELTPEEAASVTEHLEGCSDCYPAYRCDRAFLDLLARLRLDTTAPQTLVRWVRTLV
jgi:mycothiol system anti-sigma-R factor